MLYNKPYGAAGADDPYVNGDPSIGRAGSIPPAESIEYPQREIVNLINDAGLATATNSDLHQLGKAIQSQKLLSKDDTGTANAYAVTLAPAPTAYFKYMTVIFQVSNTNTGASTINVNSLGTKAIKHRHDGSDVVGGELPSGAIICVAYDGTNFQLVWSSVVAGSPVFLTSSRTIFVNTTTGNDTTLDGTAATVSGSHGPFKTIQRGVNEAFKFYPSTIYAITIQVADGTYAESVATPSIAGPAIIINGNSTTPGNVHVTASATNAITANSNTVTVQNLKFSCSAVNSAAVGANGSGANLTTINTESGVVATWVFLANGLGAVNIGTHIFRASAGFAFASSRNGAINLTGSAVYTISGSISLTAFVQANSGGQLEVPSVGTPTFVNAVGVTGTRYQATLNGVINTQGAGASYFPGTIAGTTATGGQYA